MVQLKPVIKPIALFFLAPLLVGLWAANVTVDAMQTFSQLNQPDLSPNAGYYPIVLMVLYTLMGISAYLVYKSKSYGRETPLYIWVLQLVFCFFWAITFFSGGAFQLSLVWLAILWLLIIMMTVRFYSFRHAAGFLQIPYLLCVTFAGYLNFTLYMLNK